MPSFDIVSETNLQEIDNAIQITMKEVLNRFDFKNTKSSIQRDKQELHLISDNDYKMNSLKDVLQSKLAKRGVDLRSVEFGKMEPAAGGTVKCTAKVVQGIETEKARDLVKQIKGLNIKVQAAIEGEKLRVSGKKRDDLQQVIAFLRGLNYPLPLQFNNFRD